MEPRASLPFDVPSGDLVQTYTSPLGGGFDFGVAALGDDVLMRGGIYHDADWNFYEDIYLFDGGTAEVLQAFVAPGYNNDTGPAPMVGYGDFLLVGTTSVNYWPDETYYYGSAGAVYVFDIDTGDLLTTLTDPTPGDGEHFGRGIAVQGNAVYITSESAEEATPGNSVAVWAFEASDPDPGVWTVTGAFEKPGGPNPVADARKGYSLLLQGDRLYVGAWHDDADAGAVYVFGLDGEYLNKWTSPDPQTDEYFGMALAALGDRILVGAHGDRTIGSPAGSAFLFDSDGNLVRTYLDPNPDPLPAPYKTFGWGIAVVGDYLAIADRYDDGQGENEGAVYLFNADPAGIHVAPLVNLATSEDGTAAAQFDVVLNTQPTANVTLDLSTSDPGEGLLSTTDPDVRLSAITLTFPPEDWNVPQTETVYGVEDGIGDGDQPFTVDFAASTSGDPNYSDLQVRSVAVLSLDSMTKTESFSSGLIELEIADPQRPPWREATLTASTIDVAEEGEILDLNVRLDISHPRATELDVYLVSPSGTRVKMLGHVAYVSDGYHGTILDDEASDSIQTASSPFVGAYRPAEPLSLFGGSQRNAARSGPDRRFPRQLPRHHARHRCQRRG